MGNLLFTKLTCDARDVADQFQRLVITNYRARLNRWPEASALMQLLAQKMGAHARSHEYPLDLIAVANILHINVRFVKRRVSRLSGSLIPVAGGFDSEVYTRRSGGKSLSKRERFTVAHECGHAFFFYCEGGTPTRIIPRPPDGSAAIWEEGLCDDFARVLLAAR
jgi:hypothetical protein